MHSVKASVYEGLQRRATFSDEPTGALNHASSDEVMNELLSLNRDGITIMCVIHEPKVAAKCSRVLYIVDGGIVVM